MAGNVTLRQDWTVTHTPAAATQATISKAAKTGTRWHATMISATFAAAGTAAAPIVLNLRDSTTGAGNILASWTLAAPVNSMAYVHLTGIDIQGVADQALTLEFAGAGAAATLQNVNLGGYGEIIG